MNRIAELLIDITVIVGVAAVMFTIIEEYNKAYPVKAPLPTIVKNTKQEIDGHQIFTIRYDKPLRVCTVVVSPHDVKSAAISCVLDNSGK